LRIQVERALHTHRYEHTKLKNLTLGGLNKNIYIRRESENTKKKITSHNLSSIADDDMYLHEIIIIIEKLNIAKNYLNSIE
jgi:hypothetical protein